MQKNIHYFRKSIKYATGSPLPRDEHGSSGIGALFRSDERNFQEMLSDWMLALGCSPQTDNKAFLDKTGLAPYLTSEELQLLLDGEAAPGKKLACHLAVLLPDENERKHDNLPSPLVFRRRALRAFAYAQKTSTPIVELTQEECHALHKPLADRLCTDMVPHIPYKTDEEEKETPLDLPAHPFTKKLVEYLKAINPEANEEELLEQLSRKYRTDKTEIINLLTATFPEDTTLGSWVDEVLRPKTETNAYRGPGHLLHLFRQCAGLGQVELAVKIGVPINYIGLWESGAFAIEPGKLPKLKEVLDLDEAEYNRLLFARLPALDPDWLSLQDRDKRGGLLLAAHRQHKGFLQDDLSKILGFSRNAISNWELGKHAIDISTLPTIQKVLDLDEAEYNRLLLARFPARDPDWLSLQDSDKRAGLLLTAYRELKGLKQEELTERLGYKNAHTIIKWETGASLIIASKLPRIKTELGLSDTEYQQLLLQRFPVFDPKWLSAQPENMRAGPLLAAYRQLHGLEQEELAQKMADGTTGSNISSWELARCRINGAKLPKLKAALDLDDTEYQRLLVARFPALDPQQPLTYDVIKDQMKRAGRLIETFRDLKGLTQAELEKKTDYHTLGISHIELGQKPVYGFRLPKFKEALGLDDTNYRSLLFARFPAFDNDWLSRQDTDKRAGLLLRAFRQLKCPKKEDFAKAIDSDLSTVANWEKGSGSIDISKLPLIQKTLDLDKYDYRKLVAARLPAMNVEGTSNAKGLSHTDFSKLESIKGSLELDEDAYRHFIVERLPALDPQWLSHQATDKQAGLLLKAWRVRAQLSQEALGGQIGIGATTISEWESGVERIKRHKLPDIKRALALDHFFVKPDEEFDRIFALLPSSPALNPEWLSHQEPDKQAGLLLATFRDYCGFTRPVLAEKLKVRDVDTIFKWESGRSSIEPKRQDALSTVFREENANIPEKGRWFDDAMEKYFRDICASSSEDILKRKQAMRI